jgi:hypothetical protein
MGSPDNQPEEEIVNYEHELGLESWLLMAKKSGLHYFCSTLIRLAVRVNFTRDVTTEPIRSGSGFRSSYAAVGDIPGMSG